MQWDNEKSSLITDQLIICNDSQWGGGSREQKNAFQGNRLHVIGKNIFDKAIVFTE